MIAFRCTWCDRRLFDHESKIERGTAQLVIKCPKCGSGNSLRLEAREGPIESPATASATSAHMKVGGAS